MLSSEESKLREELDFGILTPMLPLELKNDSLHEIKRKIETVNKKYNFFKTTSSYDTQMSLLFFLPEGSL